MVVGPLLEGLSPVQTPYVAIYIIEDYLGCVLGFLQRVSPYILLKIIWPMIT